MNKSTKKIIRKLHLWLGMTSGLVVFIIAITGAIYVFSEEIKHYVYQDKHIIGVPKHNKKLPITQLVQIAEKQFDNKYNFNNIVIPVFPDHTISVSFSEYDEEAFGYTNYVKFNKTVYLNPYTGEVVKIENTKWEFFTVVLAIHMHLFLGYNEVSHVIILGATWIFVILIITGLILWWPKNRRQKQKFWLRWKKKSNWKRKNYDVHQVLGFYSLIIALVFALTGLMWASKSFNTSVKWIANGGKLIPEQEIPKPQKTDKPQFPLDAILKTTLTNIPQSKYILIREHPKPSIPYIVRSYISETLNYTRIEMLYDKQTAELLDIQNFTQKNNGEKIQTLNYDLHVGSIGGLPTKILAFIISLVIASLPVTGFLIWYGRNYKRKKRAIDRNPITSF